MFCISNRSKMNTQQLHYQAGRIFNNATDVVFLGLGGYSGIAAISYSIKGVDELTDAVNIAMGTFCSWYLGREGLFPLAGRILTTVRKKEVKASPEEYPLEFVDKIVIDDKKGLEYLLLITRLSGDKEWGTALRTVHENGTAVVYEVLDPKEAIGKGFIYNQKRESVCFSFNKAVAEQFNGAHHFHPDSTAENFAVSQYDRKSPNNWVNLLTFNMPYGPEIIGFNKQFTYIPANDSKTELVKATPRQIMEYLSS